MQHAQSIRPTEESTNDSVETPGETGVHEGHVVATAPESDRARKNRQPHPRLWAKRAAVLAALAVLAAACVAATLSFGPDLWAFVADAGRLRAWVEQNELVSATAFVSANVAQIVIAFFPGEPLELAAGYAFGFWKGTALCQKLFGPPITQLQLLGADIFFFQVISKQVPQHLKIGIDVVEIVPDLCI